MTSDALQEKEYKRRPTRASTAKTLYVSKEKISAKSCLDGVTKSGIKYAIAWVAYVLIGSWLFIILEENFPPTVIVKVQQWERFKDLLSEGEVVDELLSLRRDLQKLCSHLSHNASFDDLLSETKIHISTDKSNLTNTTSSPIIKMPEEWIKAVEEDCRENLFMEIVKPDLKKWSMVDAIYYTMTLVTTIGFGHIFPQSRLGRMFCILYALVGVPLTCILMAKNSEMLSNRMLRVYESARKRLRINHPETVLCVVTWMFLSVGFIVFMFLPSVAFVHLEGWTYENSLYFTFITLTTIGFGDLVAGYNYEAPYSDVYRIAIVIWIMLALGYWILLLNFLQKAIKSNAKTLKRRFTTKKIAKQAEFLKHLMTKVKTESNGIAATPEEKLHMMAIMVESLSRKGSLISPADGVMNSNYMAFHAPPARPCSISGTGESSVNPKRTESLVDRLHLMARLVDKLSASISDDDISPELSEDDEEASDRSSLMVSSSKSDSPVKFEDLMDVNVCVKTETLPGFETLVTQTVNDPTIDETFKRPIKCIDSGEKEITLPLRDVIGLVLTVAALEEGQDLLSDCDTHSEISIPTSGTSYPNRKVSLPLLRNAFLSSKDKGSSAPTKNNYIQRTLNHYLEECEEIDEEFEDTPLEKKIPQVSLKQQALMV